MITTANPKDYIGKHLTWSEAMILFPDKWLAFSNYSKKDSFTINEGILEAVLSDEEITKYQINHSKDNFIYDRTTNDYIGSIHVQVTKRD